MRKLKTISAKKHFLMMLLHQIRMQFYNGEIKIRTFLHQEDRILKIMRKNK